MKRPEQRRVSGGEIKKERGEWKVMGPKGKILGKAKNDRERRDLNLEVGKVGKVEKWRSEKATYELAPGVRAADDREDCHSSALI